MKLVLAVCKEDTANEEDSNKKNQTMIRLSYLKHSPEEQMNEELQRSSNKLLEKKKLQGAGDEEKGKEPMDEAKTDKED
ncbi:hypothetical protein Tco_0951933 [Tanacetum coccineum]|uniref:Uncharacterized protein n=1 Tax=Tanacetum coccineum TaxID=301880 RepID=A0ABQ5DXC9_9ASTR